MLIGYARMGRLPRFNTRYFLALLTTGMVWGVLTDAGHAQVVSQAAPLELTDAKIDDAKVDQEAQALTKGLEMEKEQLWRGGSAL